MRLDDPPADGQAHAGPLGPPAAALEPVELVEHPLPLRARDAGAVVDHPQLDRVAGLAGDHLDGAAGGVAAGVVEQVGQHLVEPDRVDQHRRQLLGHVHVDPLPGRGPGPAHHRADHLGDRALDQLGVERPGLDAGHVEQVVDQPGQPVGLGVDGGQELVPLGVAPADLPVEQAGGRRLDRGQRGAQVVGDRVEQGGAQPVGLLQGQGPVALLLLLAPLHGQGGLVGEGGQDPPLGLAEPGGVGAAGDHHQRPDHVTRRCAWARSGPGPAPGRPRPGPGPGPRSGRSRTPTKRSSRSPGTSPSTAARWRPSPEGSTMAHPARSNRERTVRTTPRRVSSRLPWATRLVDRSNSMRVSRSRRSAWARRRSLVATSRLTTTATSR